MWFLCHSVRQTGRKINSRIQLYNQGQSVFWTSLIWVSLKLWKQKDFALKMFMILLHIINIVSWLAEYMWELRFFPLMLVVTKEFTTCAKMKRNVFKLIYCTLLKKTCNTSVQRYGCLMKQWRWGISKQNFLQTERKNVGVTLGAFILKYVQKEIKKK